jgi:hypothetical protein
MKLRPHEMILFALDYGDLIRPPFRILHGYGWGQCMNLTNEYLIVYGPKHENERSIFDTSPYVLPPGVTTPDSWDCEGFLLPSDRLLQRWGRRQLIKFWNYRRFCVKRINEQTYNCPWDNGVFEASQINWAIPNFSYSGIMKRLKLSGQSGSAAR